MSLRLLFLLRFCVCCLFFGKGMAILFGRNTYHLISDNPVFWETFSAFGLFVLGALALLPVTFLRQFKLHFLFPIASIVLVVSSYSKFVNVGYYPEQMIEHSLQFFLPLFWMAVIQKSDRLHDKSWIFPLKIAVALTFIGHGIFAVGYNVVLQNFIDMTTASLHMSKSQAISFLFVMGILDFIVGTLLLVSNRIMLKWTLNYMIAWGLITAFARTYWQLDEYGTAEFWLQNVPNTLFRLPNGLMSLFLYWTVFKNNVNSLR